MARYILILLCLAVSLMCTARSIEKRYSSYISEKGTIYFFRPKKLAKNTNIGKFNFDMTYVSHKDSVIVNCSVNIKNSEKVSHLELKSGDKTIPGDAVYIIFRNVIKNGYVVRVSSRFLLKDIEECFSNSNPLIFHIMSTDGQEYEATYTSSQWKEESEQVTRILNSINY